MPAVAEPETDINSSEYNQHEPVRVHVIGGSSDIIKDCKRKQFFPFLHFGQVVNI